jgi:coenzyme F420-dependent glucose-6-phosphate dehydrogenase
MVQVGFHASHEQFPPSQLLRLLRLAQEVGFECAKSSDHFHPWSERQGQSGFAWSWLGAAMEATSFPIGMISAPGYRYHPAVLAQAAATIAEMYEGRMWLALGSGEAINEAITGADWPEKHERNLRLLECVDVIRALFRGELVTHRGRVTVVEAKLYTLPREPVPLYGAAVTEGTAALAGSWADGLLVAGHAPDTLKPVVAAYRNSGGAGKPVCVQMAVSWARTRAEAARNACEQWAPASLGGEVSWDLRCPRDFDQASRFVSPEDMTSLLLVTDSIREIRDRIGAIAELGIEAVYLHMVGRDQEGFIEAVANSELFDKRKEGSGGAE